LLVISTGLSLPIYEYLRYSEELQIRNQIGLLDSPPGDYCYYTIDNTRVMGLFEEKIVGIEGTVYNRTQVGDWRMVFYYASMLRKEFLDSNQSCEIFLGLTRTLFVLLVNEKEGPRFLTIVDLVYAKYAPI
jgi:hypothetical protein